jgi:transcriptional regulator with XRE-family HTH domain
MSKIPNIDAEAKAFVVLVGGALRYARERAGWSRQDLLNRSGVDLSVQTLKGYENGTHDLGVGLLFKFCHALDIVPRVLLDAAERGVLEPAGFAYAYVDVARLAQASSEQLRPLRAWAQLRVAQLPAGHHGAEIRFDAAALDSMAALCGMTGAELTRALVDEGVARDPHEPERRP